MDTQTNPNSQETASQQRFEVNTNSVYDAGSNVFTRVWEYFAGKIWPPVKRFLDETFYLAYKVIRGIIKFALAQMGLRSGE